MSEPRNGSRIVQPEGWVTPSGYSHAMVSTGRYITLSGQIGWNPVSGAIETDDFAAQTGQALRNIVTLLGEAGAKPNDVVRLTWYITNRGEYMSARREIGVAYREQMGGHYPPMSVVVVSGLLEARAKVEIEATAVVTP